jgi:hypothetical protein
LNQGGFVGANEVEVCNFGDDEQYYPTAGIPPSEADARLIAAAPEMREAIEAVLTLIANGSLVVDYSDRRATEDDLNRLRALLARIDGATKVSFD